MKHVASFVALALFAAIPALVTIGCDDKKSAPDPAPSVAPNASAQVASASATASDSASAPIASASAAPSSSSDSDSDEPSDEDEVNMTRDITADNLEKEMEALDKEVSSKY